jgi:predicted metal-dependent peptidase
VVDEKFTAYTDGVNKRYSRWFLDTIKKESQIRGLVLHENLHIALKQVAFGRAMFEENPKMANLAADFVVNDVIENIKGTLPNSTERVVELPDGAVHDDMFHDWSMRQVFDYLKKHAKGGKGKGGQGGSGGQGNTPPSGGKQNNDDGDDEPETVTVNGKTYDVSKMDEHDFGELTPEQAQELGKEIDKALREGGLLAGRMGAKVPRVIADLLEPKVDWREALREFISSTTRGNDEYTWRKLNKRHIANDLIMPSMENETIGELVIAIDTSGSIGQRELTEFATELVSICEIVQPETVRVMWWDTSVHAIQKFSPDQYADIAKLLKPEGGGGTRVGCVSEYIIKENIKAECVIVFTDGYVESDAEWNIVPPTLWMVTQNKGWIPPAGKKVMVSDDE